MQWTVVAIAPGVGIGEGETPPASGDNRIQGLPISGGLIS